MGVVYLRTNLINGKQYVGQTVDFKKRESAWKSIKWNYANQLLTDERNKYGLDNFKVEIIKECDNVDLDYWEKYYIKKYNTEFPNGYNDNEGGKLGFHHSEETKKKIGESGKGKHYDRVGIELTEEHKRKISKAMKGKVPLTAVEKHAELSSKKVYQYTKDDKLIETYSSIREASRKTNFAYNGIYCCCKGGFFSKSRNKWVSCRTFKGYKWSFEPL